MDESEKGRASETESVCPVCFERVAARRITRGEEVFLVKECKEHGYFSTIIWRGKPTMADWQRPKEPVHPEVCYGSREKGCPFDCGLCAAHEQLPCSVVLEVTGRCNLHCAVCFADAGKETSEEPTLDRIEWLLKRAGDAAGRCNLQLSGGEPTLRDDLPEIVGIGRQIGFSFIQVNTNGLRLSADPEYCRRLKAAGLSTIFLQFDGIDDDVYRFLRGKPLLDQKLRAIENSKDAGLGVVLVPTIVRGVNTDALGAVVRQAVRWAPYVRGVHFQPISFFGRFPECNGGDGRFTLPELMRYLEEQTEGMVRVIDFSPPGTEHAHCSFHATYTVTTQGELRPMGGQRKGGCCFSDIGSGGVRNTVETISSRWKLPFIPTEPFARGLSPAETTTCCNGTGDDVKMMEGLPDFDAFLREVGARSFTISAMAFQDAENIDLERLRGCCISVISPEGDLIPFCAYNLTSREGETLYRSRNRQKERQ